MLGNLHKISILIALLTSMALTIACGGVSSKAKSLDTVTRAYEKHIRWGKFEEARAFIKGPQEYLTDSERKRLQNIRVTGYDMLNSSLTPDETKATLMVRIRFFNDEYSIEKTFMDRQVWKFDEASGHWFLDSKIPDFR